MIDFKKELNKDQLKVVYEGDGPSLVLSGPGSGKTRTIVYRAAYLLEKGIPSSRILLLTFTKKAASEMLSRIYKISAVPEKEISGGTFHHAGNLFLRKYAERIGYSRNFTIIDEDDSKSILKSVISERKDLKNEMPKPQIIQKIISLSTNSQKDMKTIMNDHFFYFEEDILMGIEEIGKSYQVRKKENNLMDYDDLLLNWNNILEIEDIRQDIASNFLYLLVDEYQDTNALQNKILKKLSSIHNNILAVGDDSQSIYSFRAADISNILNFSNNFKGARLFKLETNYRSVPDVLEVANAVIKNNTKKLEKVLKSIINKNIPPVVIPFSNSKEQANFIASYIEEREDVSEIAVLFRAHFHSVELEIELTKRRIPYILRGGIRFFEQHHIKDVVAFLRIFLNFNDEASWKRLLLKQEGIGEVNAQKIIKYIFKRKSLEEALKEKEAVADELSSVSAKNGLKSIFSLIEEAMDKDVPEKIDAFMKNFYSHYLDFSFDNAKERKNDIRKVKELSERYESLQEMLSEFSLSEDFSSEEVKKEAVVLSTIHQAKGLEWKTVFLISLKEGSFPHTKSIEDDLLEEERRLFYVGVTRCKENLFLTYPVYDFREKSMGSPSRFLSEGGLIIQKDEEIIYNQESPSEDGWESF